MGCIFSHSSTIYTTQEAVLPPFAVVAQPTINVIAPPPLPPYRRRVLRKKRWIDYRLHE